MSEDKIEPTEEVEGRLDKVKDVVKRNWKPFAIGAGATIVVFVVTRRVTLRYFPTNTMRINKMIFKDSVFYFQTYARKQGPPSYVIRCVETGQIFTSQAEACTALGIDPARMSRHLNGYPGYEVILGNKWNRKAIATPAIARGQL